MKYLLVRQFYNNSIDNFFNFFNRIVDFGKLLVETFLVFMDIWYQFFMIFINIFRYFYYLVLFGIDKSTESRSTIIFWRKLPERNPFQPGRVFTREIHNPIPAAYGRHAAAAVSQGATVAVSGIRGIRGTVGTVASAASSVTSAGGKLLKPSAGAAKRSFGKGFLQFFADLASGIKTFFMKPARLIADTVMRRMKPVKDEEPGVAGSLIEQYLKEYEKKRRA
ncbi:MAG: hypothetical protein EPN93_18555 [Spirochaetes bacterium]|nr:MAG: hypothetical protein EPN93_18555 [Spirochaetota bacterium]